MRDPHEPRFSSKRQARLLGCGGFEQFGRTRAYEDYLEYTLRPPFTLQTKLGQKMTMSTLAARSMSWSNYVARQSLRDEAMAGLSRAQTKQLLMQMGQARDERR